MSSSVTRLPVSNFPHTSILFDSLHFSVNFGTVVSFWDSVIIAAMFRAQQNAFDDAVGKLLQ